MGARSIVVAVTGLSGSGKTTVVASLARRYGWAALDEAYYRLRPPPPLVWESEAGLRELELRLLNEESRRFLEARSLTLGGWTVVVDTAFLDPVEYTGGLVSLGLAAPATFRSVAQRARKLAAERQLGVPDLTVRLSVPPAAVRARAAADPKRHPRSLRARHGAVGRWQAQLAGARAYGEGRTRDVSGAPPPDRVAQRVHALAARVRPLSDPCAVAVDVVGALVRLGGAEGRAVASGNLKKGTPSPRLPR